MSVTENGKEGKSKMIASCGFLENGLSQFSKGGVTLAGCVETLEVDFKNKSQEVESERKSDEKKVQGEVRAHEEK